MSIRFKNGNIVNCNDTFVFSPKINKVSNNYNGTYTQTNSTNFIPFTNDNIAQANTNFDVDEFIYYDKSTQNTKYYNKQDTNNNLKDTNSINNEFLSYENNNNDFLPYENNNYDVDYTYKDNKPKDVSFNGKIDKNFSQGQSGDCWLLSTIQGIKDKQGGEEYLNSLLKVENDGNISVNLKGVGEKYTISKDEINNCNSLSSGDGDVRAIEIAMYKHLQKTGNNYKMETGASPSEAMKMLVGNGYNITTNSEKMFNTQRFNDTSKVYTASFSGNNANYTQAFNLSTNQTINLVGNHAYSVVKSDNEYVYLKNPHNTSNLLRVGINDFQNLNPSISYSWLK